MLHQGQSAARFLAGSLSQFHPDGGCSDCALDLKMHECKLSQLQVFGMAKLAGRRLTNK